jgi:hypothetical protein
MLNYAMPIKQLGISSEDKLKYKMRRLQEIGNFDYATQAGRIKLKGLLYLIF